MKLTVIIPTFNEASCIKETLKNLYAHHDPDEVLVVDGGSSDATVEIAEKYARVIHTGKGRAVQMNRGVSEAVGGILFFLHADTVLPEKGVKEIREAVRSGKKAGRFRMRFDSSKWILRFYSSYTKLQIFSYGDQGLFIQKALFKKMGGFDETVPFEDLEFYKRLRSQTRPLILKSRVTTSARRFLQMGCLRQKFINILLVGLYYLGIDALPSKKTLYPDIR
jgi:rSAM/selenodomain-associated transferase 2